MSKLLSQLIKTQSITNFKAQKQVLGCKLAMKLLMKTVPDNATHINKISSEEWTQSPHLWGKALKRVRAIDGRKFLKIENNHKANVIAIGGLDFDNQHGLSALLKSLEVMLPKNLNLEFVGIYPSVNREDRYSEATKYNTDKLHYPKYVYNLVREHILPRFVEGPVLKKEIKPLIFYSFSVGGREVAMIENCLREIFVKEYGMSFKEIAAIFSNINSVSIAYAIDIADLPEPRFKKVVVISEDDLGVLKPFSFASKVIGVTPLNPSTKIEYYIIPSTSLSQETQIYYLKSGIVPIVIGDENNPKVSNNGHNLMHYIDAIMQSPPLHNIITKTLEGEQIDAEFTLCGLSTDW